MKQCGIKHKHHSSEFLKYIGPGLLVTVGFIDPGNWAANVAAGSMYGYKLLWIVTVSTFILVILQHNAAHLGIATGFCLSEAASLYLKPAISRTVLITAIMATISTAFAELLGGAVALNMLFHIPQRIGAILVLLFVLWLLFTNSYRKLEKFIIGFVSLIGFSFLIELMLVKMNWGQTAESWVVPAFPATSIAIIMSVLGAVVMPHNLFLHSEIIQSRKWNTKDEQVIKRQLKYEFLDTLFSMIIGWAINSAMIIIAAATFYVIGAQVTDLTQAEQMLKPLLGTLAAVIFAVALLFAGISAAVTAGMAGGSIYAGIYALPYNINKKYTRIGILVTFFAALVLVMFIKNPLQGLIISQMLLSIQLPITIFTQIYLTSSKKVMSDHYNKGIEKILLWAIAGIVSVLNVILFISFFVNLF